MDNNKTTVVVVVATRATENTTERARVKRRFFCVFTKTRKHSFSKTEKKMTPEDIERLNERRKHQAFETFVVPLMYAPVLSLVRFGPFKGQTRDVLFGFGIACGLAHAGYVMSRESSV